MPQNHFSLIPRKYQNTCINNLTTIASPSTAQHAARGSSSGSSAGRDGYPGPAMDPKAPCHQQRDRIFFSGRMCLYVCMYICIYVCIDTNWIFSCDWTFLLMNGIRSGLGHVITIFMSNVLCIWLGGDWKNPNLAFLYKIA